MPIRLPRNPYAARDLLRFVGRMVVGPPPRVASVATALELEPGAPRDARIALVGDVMPLMWRDARFDPALVELLAGCDVVVGNLEGILTSERWFPFLQKHTPAIFQTLDAAAPAARWVLGVANNHAPDFGDAAFRSTLRAIEDAGMRWVGTPERPRVQLLPRVTLTAWTTWTNGPAPMVAREDPGAPSTAGVHIAYPHWGWEMERQPRKEQRDAVPVGYALVAGHHAHLPQPMERLPDGRVVAWSLGNFVTEVKLRGMGEGAVLLADVAGLDTDDVRLTRVELVELLLDRSDRRVCAVSLRTPSP